VSANKRIEETEKFKCWVRHFIEITARRYVGRGAEFEDLKQEGIIAYLSLIQKCPPEKSKKEYISKRLPGRVRDAARRYRRTPYACEFTPQLEVVMAAPRKNLPIEYIDMLLFLGYTQKEIAEKLQRTQQAVSARIKKIRRKTRNILHRYWPL
jgi:DNA-directed RNA polymerase specialized sigma24 family protein